VRKNLVWRKKLKQAPDIQTDGRMATAGIRIISIVIYKMDYYKYQMNENIM